MLFISEGAILQQKSWTKKLAGTNMDGYEATEQIRSLERDDATQIPIIAMSADIFEESANTALERGMDGYISKPLNNDQLFRTLKKLINREKNQ